MLKYKCLLFRILTVLRGIAVVDSVVRGHDASNSSSYCVCERPKTSDYQKFLAMEHTYHKYVSCIVLSSKFEEYAGTRPLFVASRSCSCSFKMKCLAQATTPASWIPLIVSAIATPVRTGSGLKPDVPD